VAASDFGKNHEMLYKYSSPLRTQEPFLHFGARTPRLLCA
jgi:hypothetical protein